MTYRMRMIIFLGLTIGLFSKTYADFSNQMLLEYCTSHENEKREMCLHLLETTAQAMIFYRNLLDRHDVYLDICFPKTLESEHMRQIYVRWIQNQKENLSDPAFLGISSALSTVFSCPKQKNISCNPF